MPDPKLTLARQHNLAMLKFMESRGVAIVSELGTANVAVGSGTCIRIGARHLIATAAHVIRNHPLEQLWIVHTRSSSDKQLNLCGKGCEGGGNSDPTDVGWLEINPADVSTMGKDFVSLDQLRVRCPELGESDLAYLHGNPRDLVNKDLLASGRLTVQPVGYMTHTEPPSSRNLNPGIDVLLDYPEEGNTLGDGTVTVIPDAPGVSGGSIWAMNLGVPGLWSADSCKLIGIEHSWHSLERWVRGTQIQFWLELVAKDIPELAQEIQTFLSSSP